jgi:predicted PurR-regulated permease PerM
MYLMTGRSAAPGTEAEQVRDVPAVSGWRAAARRLLTRSPAPEEHGDDSARVSEDAGGQSELTEATPAARPRVPALLQSAAAWSWRLLLVGLLIYVTFRLALALRLVVLPLIAALLLTALLLPLTARLHRAGVPRLLATWLTFLLAIVVIAGAITLFADRVSADYSTLAAEVTRTANEVQHSLAGPPFHLNQQRLEAYTDELQSYISRHKSEIVGTALTGGKYVIEVLTGLVLTLFITFFLLKDGARIFAWLTHGLRPEPRRRVHRAGQSGWQALVNYVRGTVVVAAIHALFIGIALWLLGVPLLVPLIVLIFLAAFIPLVGILLVGALAILITLATKGWVAAVILLAVFIVENQIEGHLLQPLVVGRIVKLHPLAIILVLAVGGIVAGIPGAIVAVPLAAVVTYAWPELRSPDPPK